MGVRDPARGYRLVAGYKLHAPTDVPTSLRALSGFSRSGIIDLSLPRRDCFLLSVPDRSDFRYWIDQLLRHLSYLLHRGTSLPRHRDLVAGVCFVSVVFACVSPTVWSGLRCLGSLYA